MCIASIVVLCIHLRKRDTEIKGNARIMVDNIAKAIVVMKDNDVLQTKYIDGGFKIDLNKQPSIDDVTKNLAMHRWTKQPLSTVFPTQNRMDFGPQLSNLKM